MGAHADEWVEAGPPTAVTAWRRRRPRRSLDDVLFTGMYPAIHDRGLEPSPWLDSYLTTYVERDARLAGAVGDLASFARFVGLCAGAPVSCSTSRRSATMPA